MKKRIFAFFLTLALLLTLLPVQSFAAVTSLKGSGTETDPYRLSNAEELVFAAEQMNAGTAAYVGKFYSLTADIDLSKAGSFPMIKSFTGVLNGMGHTIKNLTVTDTTGTVPSNGYGIGFIHKNSGTVRDLSFDGAVITSVANAQGNGNSGAAVVAAENCQGAVIANVTVKNSKVDAPKVPKTAAIASMNSRSANTTGTVIATIENCAVMDTVLIGGPRAVGNAYGLMQGAIAGYHGSSVIRNCFVSNVTLQAASETASPYHAGYICGYAAGGVIDGNVVASGKIERLTPAAQQTFTNVRSGGICPSTNSYYGAIDQTKGNLIDVTNAPNNGSFTIMGKTTDAQTLSKQETFEALGWDMYAVWKMEGGIPVIRTPEERDALTLEGAGTAEDPYRIATAQDLVDAAKALNDMDTRVVGAHLALVADIDMSGINFTPINTFSGVLDGQGHKISNFTINDPTTGTQDANYRVAFIRINNGTVQNLVFQAPRITTQALSTGGYSGAAVIVGDNAHGSVISRCMVLDGIVEAPNLPKAAGIAVMNARTNNINATISKCVFVGELICGPRAGAYGPQTGGIAAYSATSTIENCLVSADITVKSNDTIQSTVVNAGGICGYINSVTFAKNVVYGGSITMEGTPTTKRVGRIYGYNAYNNGSFTENLAYEGFTVDGQTVSIMDKQNGASVSQQALLDPDTYEALGWDFDVEWAMNSATAYPHKYPVLTYGSYSASPIHNLTAVLSGENGSAVSFSWYYVSGKTMSIRLATAEDFSNGRTYTATARGSRYIREVTDLNPNTTYYYRVEGDGQVSQTGTFRTGSDDGSFTFLTLGDTEAKDIFEANVAGDTLTAARSMVPHAAFLLHTGDFVTGSRGAEGWKEFLFCASDSLYKLPLVPTKGEEDTAFAEYFYLKNSYYSFDYGNAHMIVLDTEALTDTQLAWLKTDVAKTDREWVILSMHKGPYTSGSHAEDAEIKALRDLFIGELDDLGIDLVIQGHDHIVGHTYDLKDGALTGRPVYTETLKGKRFDYTVDATGTVYMMSGTAGALQGTQMDVSDLDAYILQFARSAGSRTAQTFASVTVEADRLRVDSYELHGALGATLVEGFGIDRQISKVETLIAQGSFTAARTAYNALSSAQKAQVGNVSELILAEGAALLTDGGAWLDETALQRRSILIHNDTDNAFTQAPVLVKVESVPSRTMAFYTTEGEALPFEVESYDPVGISLIWVKIPYVPAEGAAGLWVYFGGRKGCEDGQAVWSDSYALVEHFAQLDGKTDSTGTQQGTVKGQLHTSDLAGNKGAAFDGNSSVIYDSIGDDFNQISVSALVSLSAEAVNGSAGIVSKHILGDPTGKNAYLLGINNEGKLHTQFGCVWWRDNQARQREYVSQLLADGEPHLITVTYNGFTVETYVDGKSVAWETVFIESTALQNKNIPTTIGAYSPMMGDTAVTGGFKGNIYDVQINGARTNDQWEAFRYATILGNAVTVGQAETKGALTLTVDAATRSVRAEAGKQALSVILSTEAVLFAEVNGRAVELGAVKAGQTTLQIPVVGTGAQTVILTAQAGEQRASAQLTLSATDTTAPESPELSASEDGTVHVQTKEAEGDELTVEFTVVPAIALSAENTKVAQGSTSDKTPDAVDPASLTYAELSDTLTTTVTDGTNPYQIYRVSLTEEQRAYGAWRFFWEGQSSRQIHAYAYDLVQRQWVKLASTKGSEELSLHILVEGTQYAQDGTLYLMLFRGMGQELSHMTSFAPEDGQYDFTMFWNSDTQYMSQFAEETVYHQYQWIAETFAENKGVITFNTGDIANRSNLRYDYNWKSVDKSYRIFEEAGIPYTLCWGNHDINYDGRPNESRYYQTYFPTDRFADNAGDWEVSFAPDSVTGTTSRAMALKQTLKGAKLMLLSLAYENRLSATDLDWAEEMVKSHPDYTVILLTHTYSDDAGILTGKIRSRLVDVYENIRLVLNGHFDGASTYKMANGGFAVLQDYQGEGGGIKHGGEEFLRLIRFDVENDLVYFHTYSPLTGETLSPYGAALDPAAEGLYQKNGDEFAISLKLGGDQSRSFTTTSLAMSGAEPLQVQALTVVEGEAASLKPESLSPGEQYLCYVRLRDSSDNVTESRSVSFTVKAEEKPQEDSSLKINHTLNLASDISVNLAVSKALLTGFDMTGVYVESTLDVFEGNTKTGTRTFRLYPVEQGSYYYFTLNGLTAVNMNDRIRSVLYGTKEGKSYCSPVDDYSIADYAYSQLEKAKASRELKILCADLLRYGSAAQIYKGYRTDALADSLMSESHRALLTDLEGVEFANVNRILDDLELPEVTWVGKALDLNSKVTLRFIFHPGSYAGPIEELRLKVRFTDHSGSMREQWVTEAQSYDSEKGRYAFDFDGLLAAELRTVVAVQVYHGDKPLSCTMEYSPDTYGNNKKGDLLTLCKALFAYSDSAKSYFSA